MLLIPIQGGQCGDASNLIYTIDDHVVKAAYPEGCMLNELVIPGIPDTYRALQMHIHLFSEHSIDGYHFPAELHIVHARDDLMRFAVVGMMLQPTALDNHPVFEDLLTGWEAVASATEAACARRALGEAIEPRNQRELQGANWNAYELLPENPSFFHYDGGLTTPPCSQVVWWNLASKPTEISVSQFNRLSDYILNFVDPTTCAPATVASVGGSTSRPPQPLNGRSVDLICQTGMMAPPKKGKNMGMKGMAKKMPGKKDKKKMGGMMKDKKAMKKGKYYRHLLNEEGEVIAGIRGASV